MNVSAAGNAVSGLQLQAKQNQSAPEGSPTEEAHESPATKAKEQQSASIQTVSATAPSTNGAGKILNLTV